MKSTTKTTPAPTPESVPQDTKATLTTAEAISAEPENKPPAAVPPVPEGTVVSGIAGMEVFTRVDVDYGHLPKPK